MTHVVFTTIDCLQEMENARWKQGDNGSYEVTKRMLPASQDNIHLIGRRNDQGSVQLQFARNDRQWRVVGHRHVVLARYFLDQFASRPKPWDGRPFAQSINNDAAQSAAQQLIGLECGVNVPKIPSGKLHIAILQVQASLEALGVPCGDWTFIPMFNSFEVT